MLKEVWGCAIVLLGAVQPGWAQDEQESLRSAARLLPDSVLSLSLTGADSAEYLDVAMLPDLQAARWKEAAMRAASDLRPVAAYLYGSPEIWRDRTGFPVDQLDYVAGYGQAPHNVAVWGFADEADAIAAFDGLAAKGFAPDGADGGILANGAPNAVDFARRDPGDPWRGILGLTSVVTRVGPALLQASAPGDAIPVDPGASIADTARGKTLLAALEAQEGTVRRALFIGPAQGIDANAMLPITDPAAVEDMDALRAMIMEHALNPADGVPPYHAAGIADLDGPDGAFLAIALAYDDCETAKAASQKAAELWPVSNIHPPEEEAVAGHVAAEAGCAATITVRDGSDMLFIGALDRLAQGDLTPIRIKLD